MKMDKWIFTLIVAALISSGCKQSKPPITVDFSQMNFAEVKAVADKGYPAAQFELGERFYHGYGILKDSTEAVDWWRRAALQNFPPAEYELGLALGLGDGVPKDKEEGSKWCRMAADAKLPVAEDFEGIAYTLGKTSVTQNFSEAFKWFNAAANQNYPPSQYRLGLCYRDGKGTMTNISEAVVWFQRAASNGVANAQEKLGKYYGDQGLAQVDVNSSFENLRTNSNFVIAFEWFQKAANQGDIGGQIGLGTAYATGCGVDKNPIEAYKWLTLASAKDSNSITTLINDWKTDNVIVFTSEQIVTGKQQAEEFSKTNRIPPKSVREIVGL